MPSSPYVICLGDADRAELESLSLALAHADPLGDEDRLADRVGVPRRTAPGAKWTTPPMTREGADGMLTTSM